jgi:type II secretory pathway component PulF
MTNPLMQPAVLVVIGAMLAFMAGLMLFSIEDLVNERRNKG